MWKKKIILFEIIYKLFKWLLFIYCSGSDSSSGSIFLGFLPLIFGLDFSKTSTSTPFDWLGTPGA